MQIMRDAGAYGVGMSSFGPTVYTIVDDNNRESFKDVVEEHLPEGTQIIPAIAYIFPSPFSYSPSLSL